MFSCPQLTQDRQQFSKEETDGQPTQWYRFPQKIHFVVHRRWVQTTVLTGLEGRQALQVQCLFPSFL